MQISNNSGSLPLNSGLLSRPKSKKNSSKIELSNQNENSDLVKTAKSINKEMKDNLSSVQNNSKIVKTKFKKEVNVINLEDKNLEFSFVNQNPHKNLENVSQNQKDKIIQEPIPLEIFMLALQNRQQKPGVYTINSNNTVINKKTINSHDNNSVTIAIDHNRDVVINNKEFHEKISKQYSIPIKLVENINEFNQILENIVQQKINQTLSNPTDKDSQKSMDEYVQKTFSIQAALYNSRRNSVGIGIQTSEAKQQSKADHLDIPIFIQYIIIAQQQIAEKKRYEEFQTQKQIDKQEQKKDIIKEEVKKSEMQRNSSMQEINDDQVNINELYVNEMEPSHKKQMTGESEIVHKKFKKKIQ